MLNSAYSISLRHRDAEILKTREKHPDVHRDLDASLKRYTYDSYLGWGCSKVEGLPILKRGATGG